MPQRVYNNVIGQKVIDNGRVAEDVTSVTLPTIKNKTTQLSVAGMIMDVDMPDMTRLEAMEFAIAHNNGLNCRYLGEPGKHIVEVRLARQRYDVPQGEIAPEGVKYRVTGIHKETDKGNAELGNPLGSTDKYSVVRYEEELNGEIVTIIDALAGVIKYNGTDYASAVDNLLN